MRTTDLNAKDLQMNARQTTQKHADTLIALLERMTAAAKAAPQEPKLNWGDAEQMADALKWTVYGAFSLGVVTEDEARDLGFPC